MYFCEKAFDVGGGACPVNFGFKTNGFQGGDSGHGGFLEVRLDMEGNSLDLEASTDDNTTNLRQVRKLTLTFSGDGEMTAAAEFFEQLGQALSKALDLSSQGG